ncbi:unnamed protein product [Arabidopsis lyrata]|nr:unnamed protein product [Arabidopsis lyrata]
MEEVDALILLLPFSLDIISQSPSSDEVQRRRTLFILSSMLWLRRIMRSFCVHGGGEEGGDGRTRWWRRSWIAVASAAQQKAHSHAH